MLLLLAHQPTGPPLPPDPPTVTGLRTTTALGYGVTMRTRIEIWFGDTQIDEVGSDHVVTGGVTDTWATGARRSLDMTVEPSDDWLEWLRIGVEIRPYRGVNFGANDEDVEEYPLGRFPVRKFSRPITKGAGLPVRAQDRWQRVVANSSSAPRKALRGLVTRVVAQLIYETDTRNPVRIDGYEPSVFVPAGVWTRRRHEVIDDLLTSIAREAFFDRDGVPVIRKRPGTGTPVTTLRAGRGGTVSLSTLEIDWEKAYNAVTIIPTATDTKLFPLRFGITRPDDPAHPSVITGGVSGSGWQEFSYSSPVFTTNGEMLAAAQSLLRKVAAPARQYTITCVPNPSLDASDTVMVDGADGVELAQIQSITHPLTADQQQQITTVSTRTDDDETP